MSMSSAPAKDPTHIELPLSLRRQQQQQQHKHRSPTNNHNSVRVKQEKHPYHNNNGMSFIRSASPTKSNQHKRRDNHPSHTNTNSNSNQKMRMNKNTNKNSNRNKNKNKNTKNNKTKDNSNHNSHRKPKKQFYYSEAPVEPMVQVPLHPQWIQQIARTANQQRRSQQSTSSLALDRVDSFETDDQFMVDMHTIYSHKKRNNKKTLKLMTGSAKKHRTIARTNGGQLSRMFDDLKRKIYNRMTVIAAFNSHTNNNNTGAFALNPNKQQQQITLKILHLSQDVNMARMFHGICVSFDAETEECDSYVVLLQRSKVQDLNLEANDFICVYPPYKESVRNVYQPSNGELLHSITVITATFLTIKFAHPFKIPYYERYSYHISSAIIDACDQQNVFKLCEFQDQENNSLLMKEQHSNKKEPEKIEKESSKTLENIEIDEIPDDMWCSLNMESLMADTAALEQKDYFEQFKHSMIANVPYWTKSVVLPSSVNYNDKYRDISIRFRDSLHFNVSTTVNYTNLIAMVQRIYLPNPILFDTKRNSNNNQNSDGSAIDSSIVIQLLIQDLDGILGMIDISLALLMRNVLRIADDSIALCDALMRMEGNYYRFNNVCITGNSHNFMNYAQIQSLKFQFRCTKTRNTVRRTPANTSTVRKLDFAEHNVLMDDRSSNSQMITKSTKCLSMELYSKKSVARPRTKYPTFFYFMQYRNQTVKWTNIIQSVAESEKPALKHFCCLSSVKFVDAAAAVDAIADTSANKQNGATDRHPIIEYAPSKLLALTQVIHWLHEHYCIASAIMRVSIHVRLVFLSKLQHFYCLNKINSGFLCYVTDESLLDKISEHSGRSQVHETGQKVGVLPLFVSDSHRFKAYLQNRLKSKYAFTGDALCEMQPTVLIRDVLIQLTNLSCDHSFPNCRISIEFDKYSSFVKLPRAEAVADASDGSNHQNRNWKINKRFVWNLPLMSFTAVSLTALIAFPANIAAVEGHPKMITLNNGFNGLCVDCKTKNILENDSMDAKLSCDACFANNSEVRLLMEIAGLWYVIRIPFTVIHYKKWESNIYEPTQWQTVNSDINMQEMCAIWQKLVMKHGGNNYPIYETTNQNRIIVERSEEMLNGIPGQKPSKAIKCVNCLRCHISA